MGPTPLSLSLAGSMLLALGAIAPAYAATKVKNIVIVHGSLADGSGWRKVYDLLTAKGYNVTIVQPLMTTPQDDVAATKRVFDLQDGLTLLVGHSYGGMVITEAGNADNVAGLVYVAAFQPDAGENLVGLAGKIPPATKGITATADGFRYLAPKVYAKDFAADVPAADATFMAHSQVFRPRPVFEAKIKARAWKAKKSWAASRSAVLVQKSVSAAHPPG